MDWNNSFFVKVGIHQIIKVYLLFFFFFGINTISEWILNEIDIQILLITLFVQNGVIEECDLAISIGTDSEFISF